MSRNTSITVEHRCAWIRCCWVLEESKKIIYVISIWAGGYELQAVRIWQTFYCSYAICTYFCRDEMRYRVLFIACCEDAFKFYDTKRGINISCPLSHKHFSPFNFVDLNTKAKIVRWKIWVNFNYLSSVVQRRYEMMIIMFVCRYSSEKKTSENVWSLLYTFFIIVSNTP